MLAGSRPTFSYVCRLEARGPVGDGAAVMSDNWVALVWTSREPGCRLWCINIGCSCYPVGVVCLTCGRFPHPPPPRGDGCSDVETGGEMNVVAEACALCSRLCYGWGCVDWWVECVVSTVRPIEDVGRLHPVDWHRDGPPAHEKLHCLLPPWQDLVGAAVGGLQSSACCIPTEEDVGALLEVAVHECSRGGVTCCWNWSEAGHVVEELGDEMRWVHWVGSRS
jgi:hypothetical protein